MVTLWDMTVPDLVGKPARYAQELCFMRWISAGSSLFSMFSLQMNILALSESRDSWDAFRPWLSVGFLSRALGGAF